MKERTKFGGIGKPRGTWKKRRYLPDGTVVEDCAKPPPVRTTGYSVRFKPHISYQPHESDAKALGLKRTKDKGTVFETERQLNNYLAREKSLGRDTGWKDW